MAPLVTVLLLMTSFLSLDFASGIIDIPPEVPRPPRITEQPGDVTYAILKKEIVLECAANAFPNVAEMDGYSWTKNGDLLSVSRDQETASIGSIVMSQDNGTIRFIGSQTYSEDELMQFAGTYQCFAANEYGVAITRPTALKIARTPYIPPANIKLNVMEGESVTVPCNYSTSDEYVTKWFFDPDTLSINERVTQTRDGTLVISNVVGTVDEGLEFYCTVKDEIRRSADGPHYILQVNMDDEVLDSKPRIVSPSSREPRIVLRGDEMKLICAAVGSPTPVIKWTKQSGDWPKSGFEVTDSGKTVTISEVTYDDTGDYKCTASNYIGETATEVSILVHSRPFFGDAANKPSDVIVVPGGDVTIPCKPEGIPLPTTEWRVNGVPIAETADMPNREVFPNRIVLMDLQELDSAVYQCISTNRHGSLIEQAFVNVISSKPIPLSENKEVYQQVIGNSIEMKCLVFGSPPPTITWKKSGADFIIEDRYSLRDGKYLNIEKLTYGDAGDYSCVAANVYGTATVNETLEVLKHTEIQTTDLQTVYRIKKGDSLDITVEITSDPKLKTSSVTWTKSKVKIARGSSFAIEDASFNDRGMYVASVTTPLDSAKAYITVTVQDVPQPPTNVKFTVDQIDPFQVTFTWVSAQDNYSPILAYKIEFENVNSDSGEWRILKDSLAPSLNEGDVTLSPYVNYRFRMWAQNALGWSRTASEVTSSYQTPMSEPQLNPSGVTGEGNSPTNMVISWDAVGELDRNGLSFAYNVSYCMRSPDCETWKSAIVNGSVTSFTVNDTPTYTPYSIKVQSVNSVGPGPEPTVFVGYSGEDVPLNAPTEVSSTVYREAPTKATINWSGVNVASVRGKLLGYTITYYVKDSTEFKAVNVLGEVTSAAITDLRPYTEYSVNVAAYNSFAAGPSSTDIALKTPEGASSQPVNLRITYRSENKLVVAWDSPANPNGVIVGYGFQYKCLDNPNDKMELTVIPKTSITLANLTPENRYVITVKANNSYGFGNQSVIEATTFGQTAPEASPVNVTSGYDDINVTWFSTKTGLNGKEFVVDYKKYGTDEWKGEKTYSSHQTGIPVTVTGLEPGTMYYVRVVAVNDYGTAEPEIVTISTSGKVPATGSITSEIWFIVVLCLGVLIILVIVAIFFLKRNRGGKYSVAEKEEQLMESQPINDDNGEYNIEQDGGLKQPLTPISNDNQNNGNPPIPGLQLTTPLRTRGDSVGGDSIDAFADADAKEFDEDGSFIGQYGTINESNHASAATSPGEGEMPEHLEGDAV